MSRTRTPERIVDAALALFNEYGEPGVTTNRISDELEISPGNLHYHFRTKQSLVDELFARFERRMLDLLAGGGEAAPDIEDAWLFLHLVFETIADYRFIYRDLNELCARSRSFRQRFRAILKLSMRTADNLLLGLERAGRLQASPDEREALVRNILLISSYWISFDQIFEASGQPQPDRAAWQVMSLVSPFLIGPARQQFELLGSAYRVG